MWLFLFGGWEDSDILRQLILIAAQTLIKEKQLKALTLLETGLATKN
jgi:hypothetical protein